MGERQPDGREPAFEICPYQPNHSHHYLAHLDGEQGVVAGLKGHGDEHRKFL